jgi:CRISPR type III-A-associated protein Csm2
MGPPRLVPIPTQDVLQKIVIQGDGAVLVDWGEKIGKALRGKVHLATVRRIYGTLKRLELGAFDEAAKREMLLLRPRLAYTVKRQSSATGLAQVLEPALRIVAGPEHLRNLIDFFEAILAYHRE